MRNDDRMERYAERLNESVRPLITVVTNYFNDCRRDMDIDQMSAVLSLSIALKNWERIEQEFIKTMPPETKKPKRGRIGEKPIANFKFNRDNKLQAKVET